jgi:hypothetical protein
MTDFLTVEDSLQLSAEIFNNRKMGAFGHWPNQSVKLHVHGLTTKGKSDCSGSIQSF